jgi:CRISPR-associated protein Cmr4
VWDLDNNSKLYCVQAITPLHVGTGRGIGFIDMPIMREKVTNWPLLPGSAVKGVMRDHFTENGSADQKKLIDVAFGKQVLDQAGDDSSNSGSLVLTDAHIVCLPIRSLYGTFAYTTSHLVLERLGRDLDAAGFKEIPPSPVIPVDDAVFVSKGSKLVVTDKTEDKVFFEDLDFKAKADETTGRWAEMLGKLIFSKDTAWQAIFKERFAVISDDVFNFLAENGTEVSAHVRIEDDKKIVAKGALWYEESLPAEAILAGIAWCDRVYNGNGVKEKQIIDTYCSGPDLNLQIGGKATVGKGRVRCIFS